MSNINRITADKVSEAYKKTGLTPVNSEWGFISDNEEINCGCALTAIAYSNKMTEPGITLVDILNVMEETNGHAVGDYDENYLNGFIDAYDGLKRSNTHELYILGVEDGTAAFNKMKEEGAFA
ncbi:hypothetical protein QTG56_24405 (plasmid) [Rossellomorea sp. AcN35-11]|nr:hypothetical protein [Rossellomorea aquimaris]WJV31777.1 hypothetical protein QTG56_24405 [Rossellomorea sp. AcN35-11]